MYMVTLISNPKIATLEPVLANNLRSAWGGGELRWLSANEAVEFSVAAKPDSFWSSWKDLQELKIDLVIQPTRGRKKLLFLADMDSTMIQQECIDELADYAGVGPQVAAITTRVMNGDLDFKSSLVKRVALLKGTNSGIIDTVLANHITLMPGATTLLATLKANNIYTALVSGGFTDFTTRIAADLGFDEHHANTLIIEDGKLTGKVTDPILGRDAKVLALNEITERLGITTDQTMAVGDGANDLGMLHAAGAGVAAHAKPAVAEQCDIRINHCDLTALLYMQGYNKSEFVT
ncbi:MAG: phosphoserine phosphatase SerB [Marinosulfonomonas sp.]|nr:MAG: phosphoserine phosphatase SerB [Marinosulfonomonas sp.]